MRHRTKKSYSEQMQDLVEEYRASGGKWPATAREIAKWLIQNRKWDRSETTLVDLCARDVARAMRDEYYTDPQGRRVRTKHAAMQPSPDAGNAQMTIWDWDDIRSAPREFMERAFKGRRNQIVGDCVQLDTDVKSYNENKSKNEPIQMLFDFTDDVAEAEQTGNSVEASDDDNQIFEHLDDVDFLPSAAFEMPTPPAGALVR